MGDAGGADRSEQQAGKTAMPAASDHKQRGVPASINQRRPRRSVDEPGSDMARTIGAKSFPERMLQILLSFVGETFHSRPGSLHNQPDTPSTPRLPG